MNELKTEPSECALISTKRMYVILMMAEEKLLQNTINKEEIFSLVSSVKHDVRLLNDKDNCIERDLFE